MLICTIGDILAIRKHYQKTFNLNSDEPTSDNTLTCLSTGKLEMLLSDVGDEPLTGNLLWQILSESLVEVPIDEADNFHAEITDPDAGGGTFMGLSGKNKFDSYNFYDPETKDDTREYTDPSVKVKKSAPKPVETEYNQTRTTSTGRKARVN